ncbi:MAG: hypothetical protein JST30_13595 [Armatimonadetes bacterium]|nr:hypothetical protein [Armatimonadota bacterium]
MVQCACGKNLDKVPNWLQSASVSFVCNNCPNRTVKAITQVTLETVRDPDQEAIGAIESDIEEDDDSDE